MVAVSCAVVSSIAWAVPLAAFFGAALSTLLVLGISEAAGASKISLVLTTGVAVSHIFSAVIGTTVMFFPNAMNGYSDFRIGGFSWGTATRILPAAWVIVLGLLAAFLFA